MHYESLACILIILLRLFMLFCLDNNKFWNDTKLIINNIKNVDFDNVEHTIYTSMIKSDVQDMTDHCFYCFVHSYISN